MLKPYYKDKDLLLYQLSFAQEMYDLGQMNYAHLKRGGGQPFEHYQDCCARAKKVDQLHLGLHGVSLRPEPDS